VRRQDNVGLLEEEGTTGNDRGPLMIAIAESSAATAAAKTARLSEGCRDISI